MMPEEEELLGKDKCNGAEDRPGDISPIATRAKELAATLLVSIASDKPSRNSVVQVVMTVFSLTKHRQRLWLQASDYGCKQATTAAKQATEAATMRRARSAIK